MTTSGTTFEVEGASALAETDKALLVRADIFPDGQAWIPISQIHDDSDVYKKGDSGTLLITEWLAKKNGWL